MSTKAVIMLGSLGCVVVLAGCSTPVVPKEPLVIPYEATLDTVHVRDDSAWDYYESRAGAAVREEEFAQVLYNNHYEADPAVLQAMAQAKKAQEDVMAKVIAGTLPSKAKDESSTGKKSVSKDRSIYALKGTSKPKDKSVYTQDKSIYAGKVKSAVKSEATAK